MKRHFAINRKETIWLFLNVDGLILLFPGTACLYTVSLRMPSAEHFDLSLSMSPHFGMFGSTFDLSSVSVERKLLSEQDITP